MGTAKAMQDCEWPALTGKKKGSQGDTNIGAGSIVLQKSVIGKNRVSQSAKNKGAASVVMQKTVIAKKQVSLSATNKEAASVVMQNSDPLLHTRDGTSPIVLDSSRTARPVLDEKGWIAKKTRIPQHPISDRKPAPQANSTRFVNAKVEVGSTICYTHLPIGKSETFAILTYI